jgi:hypothetical protein
LQLSEQLLLQERKFISQNLKEHKKHSKHNSQQKKIKLEFTTFATQQVPAESTFEHNELTEIIEKLFTGFTKHNAATLARLENEKSALNHEDVPSDGEEDEPQTQKQQPSAVSSANSKPHTNNNNTNSTKTTSISRRAVQVSCN